LIGAALVSSSTRTIAIVALISLSSCERLDQPAGRTPTIPAEASTAQGASRETTRRFWDIYRDADRLRISGENAKAAERYLEALAIDKDHEDSLYALGNVRLAAGQEDQARQAFRRLVDVNSFSARGFLQLGSLAVDPDSPLFDPAAARGAFERAQAINREETGAQAGLAEAALLSGDTAASLHHAGDVLVTHPANRRARLIRGYARWRSGDLPAAKSDLEAAAGDPLVAHAKRQQPDVPSEGDTKKGSAAATVTADIRERGLLARALARIAAQRREPGGIDANAEYERLDRDVKSAIARNSRTKNQKP